MAVAVTSGPGGGGARRVAQPLSKDNEKRRQSGKGKSGQGMGSGFNY